MFRSAICLALATLGRAQWAFTVPDGDLGEVAPLNDVRQGDIHNFKWQVGLDNQPVAVLDNDGHASLWITSGLDHSFSRLLAANIDSSTGGTWAWDTGTLSDDVIDSCQGVFIYRIERPVSSEAATYDWDTDLSVSSVSFRIRKRSDLGTTQSAPTTTEAQEPIIQTTFVTQTTVATSFAVETTENTDSSTTESTIVDPTTTSEQTGTSTTAASNPTDTTTTARLHANLVLANSQAGIGIGAVAAVALIAIAGILLYRRPRKGRGAPAQIEGAGGTTPEEKPHIMPTQQREYNGSGWADYPEVAQQQQYPGASRAEMTGEGYGYGRHELTGER
ncbi:uncharacterized protein N0V89_002874 [Didymosphaeria variabile]|uniref:Mid2 domain-containing protein n=1 Tax=Didymosphaeria variabile TaxID=1932322 RepID=A0A9W8XV00_9PLEO|nr:uncharacterized protein N0V89_002874 [Didymosphaeria variabile]KAJ4358293.1 hypothetical protein N0V89_002874 [Didymosphaeria variabile]